MTKLHSLPSGNKHWILIDAKVACPDCKASGGHPCVDSHNKRGQILNRLPMHSVHAERIAAAGHNVRVI